jgi:hypothetical protein
MMILVMTNHPYLRAGCRGGGDGALPPTWELSHYYVYNGVTVQLTRTTTLRYDGL